MSVESGSRDICPDYYLHNDGCSTTPYIKEPAAGETVRGLHCTLNVFVVAPQYQGRASVKKHLENLMDFYPLKNPPSFLELMECYMDIFGQTNPPQRRTFYLFKK